MYRRKALPLTNNLQIEEHDNYIYVKFPYNPEMVLKAKALWPYKWDKHSKAWLYPSALKQEVYRHFQVPMPPGRPRKYFNNGTDPSGFLLSHQKKAPNIAEKMPKYCFFFDTGTGKTISALEVIKQKQCKGLIVAPLST
ncbi:MAG TPA: hypothetical protein ENG89_00570, partial [Candidatus Moranbacteria bacterium]|nr:hypothetical protein [Candidatus Moranbacteria bacterium]